MDIVCGVKDRLPDDLIDEAFTSCYRDRHKSQNHCQNQDCYQCTFPHHFSNFLSFHSPASVLSTKSDQEKVPSSVVDPYSPNGF